MGGEVSVFLVSTAPYVAVANCTLGWPHKWSNCDADGNPLPEGVYDLSLESYLDDEVLGKTAVEYFGRISEIRSSASGVTALFAGGIEVSTALITALRDPAIL